MEILQQLTMPQATLFGGLLGFLGPIVAVFIGWRFYVSKVSDLQSAIAATEDMLARHKSDVEENLDKIDQKISQVSSSLSNLQADVSDFQEYEESDDSAVDNLSGQIESVRPEEDIFEDFRLSWLKIRGALEQIAADPSIDGRTSAKYARIDRRKYSDLVDSLSRDGRLAGREENFRKASNLWASHRTRRKKPTFDDLEQMRKLERTLLGASVYAV